MKLYQIIEEYQKNVKKIKIISYIQVLTAIPLLYISMYFILFILFSMIPIYYCRQLSENLSELEDRIYKMMPLVAEEAAIDAAKHQEIIKYISIILGVVTAIVVWYAIGIYLAYVFMVFSPLLSVGMYLLCLEIDFPSIPQKLDEQKEPDYSPEDLIIKSPRERPIKKTTTSTKA